jgi:hypothetical protein
MSAMSNYLELEVLDHILSVGAYSMPADIYLGLSVASMAEDASGTELSGNAYARQAITFAAASGGSSASNATVTFPTATGSWGTVAYWSIWDAASSGNMMLHGAFSASKVIGTGDILRVNSGDVTVTAA